MEAWYHQKGYFYYHHHQYYYYHYHTTTTTTTATTTTTTATATTLLPAVSRGEGAGVCSPSHAENRGHTEGMEKVQRMTQHGTSGVGFDIGDMSCNAVQYSAIQCNTVQCSTIHFVCDFSRPTTLIAAESENDGDLLGPSRAKGEKSDVFLWP